MSIQLNRMRSEIKWQKFSFKLAQKLSHKKKKFARFAKKNSEISLNIAI